MATGILFIGWGQALTGREQKAYQVFSEGIETWTRWQQQGKIDSFEPFTLEPHGGELTGFCLLHGDPQKLSQLRVDPEFVRLNGRAGLVVAHLGVVAGYTGEDLQRQFAQWSQDAAELA
jgi:hypothetical protein